MDAQALWPTIAADLAPDGALRDIYVREIGLAEWEQVWRAIQTRYAPVRYSIDGEPAPLPAHAADAFAVRPAGSPLATFDVGPVELACHFFDRAEIEFDLVPNDVTSPAIFAPLLAFLQALATWTGRPSLLTHENRPEDIIVQVRP
jgi:hypothetical protein